MEIQFINTYCPLCGRCSKSRELYPANFSSSDFNPEVFSARRMPDRIHYRIVECTDCGLVRSDPIVDQDIIVQMYRQSFFTYDYEVANLSKTYGYYLRRLEYFGINKGSLLEIGCGNGFFLEEALAQGYQYVNGVEPAKSVVESARPDIRRHILVDIFKPGLFESGTFDAICVFQVLDHLPDPNLFVQECHRILKKNGAMLCINHDISAFTNRLMGERSPIIDIEHTYLYNPFTFHKLFTNNGFEVVECKKAWNYLSLQYLIQLFPLPKYLKESLRKIFEKVGINVRVLNVPIGNLYLISIKR